MRDRGAAAAISDEDGRLLLIKENYDRRRWSFPGGAIEPGETPEEAVAREVREETGVEAAIEHRIGCYTLQGGLAVHLFRCRISSGTPAVPIGDEIEAVEWIDPAAIPEPHSNILHHALADVLNDVRGVERNDLPRIN